MIHAHYGDLFRDDPELMGRYSRLRPKVFELTDFLVNVAKIELAEIEFAGPVTYHDSCSGLRELGVKTQPRELLAQAGVPGHRNEGLRTLLRFRRHVRDQVRRHLHGDRRREVREHRRERYRCGGAGAISAAC